MDKEEKKEEVGEEEEENKTVWSMILRNWKVSDNNQQKANEG